MVRPLWPPPTTIASQFPPPDAAAGAFPLVEVDADAVVLPVLSICGKLTDRTIDYKVNNRPSQPLDSPAMTDLQTLAKQHLMLHFSDMTLEPEDIPVLVRGDGCHIYDDKGNRYIDGLSGLYCTNLGHSHGEEIGAAAAAQMATLPFTTNWTTAHPPSIDLGDEARRARPRRLRADVLHLGRLGVGRVRLQDGAPVASGQRRARAQARSSPAATPTTAPRSAPSPSPASRSAGRRSSRPRSRPATSPRRTPTATPPATTRPPSRSALLDEIEDVIEFERPETIAMIIMEPVQNAGGSIVPPAGYWDGLREICDQPRDPARLRRGDLRLRPDRRLVRRPAPRLAAGHDHLREGPHRRALLDGRPADERQGRRAVPDRQERLPARDHLRRPPRRLGDRAEGDRDHGARERARRTSARTSRGRSSCSRASRTSRSSATSAASATSSRSSASRTRTRASR